MPKTSDQKQSPVPSKTIKPEQVSSFNAIHAELQSASTAIKTEEASRLPQAASTAPLFFREFIYLFLIDSARLYAQNKKPDDYEKEEPGFLSGMLKGYKGAWGKEINRQMSHDLLITIHALVVGHDIKCDPGRYKKACNNFPIFTNTTPHLKPQHCRPNASIEGFREFLTTWMIEPAVKLHEIDVIFPGQMKELLANSFKLVANGHHLEMRTSHDEIPGSGEGSVSLYDPQRDNVRFEYALDRCNGEYNPTQPMPNDFYICFLNSMVDYLAPTDPLAFASALNFQLDTIFKDYNTSIKKASSNDEKLAVIAKYVQRISQLHPFKDGNTRTCYVLLNRLLKEEGLDMTLFIDPNRLDCFSVRELVEFIKEGQKYVESLLLFDTIPAFEKDKFLAPFIEAKLNKSQIQPFLIDERASEYQFFVELLLTEAKKMRPSLQQRQFDNYVHDIKIKYKLVDLSDKSIEWALRKAAANNIVDDITFILTNFSINIDAQDGNPASLKTALFLAAERGHEESVMVLLNAGARIDILTAKAMSAQEMDIIKSKTSSNLNPTFS